MHFLTYFLNIQHIYYKGNSTIKEVFYERKLINSFLILTASTLITKVFSLLNRMLLSRLLDENGMALYILVIPTLSLCITLAQFSIPFYSFSLNFTSKIQQQKDYYFSIMYMFYNMFMYYGHTFVFFKNNSCLFSKTK